METTFETVYHLYKVDEILRDIFRRYIEKAEVYYRTQIAYGFSIAKCTETPYDQHYDENNFYNKKGYREVMGNFSREKNYYADFNPPAKFITTFLRKHSEIKNNSLFAYTLVLLKRLPDESSKKSLIQTVENVISEYSDDIDLKLIGFPENYMEIMKNNL